MEVKPRSLRGWEPNSVLDLINIAAFTLDAEIAAHKEQYDKSAALLRKAIEIEDKLMYQEPPDWVFSVRHSLGHVLVKAQKFAEAEKIYRQDLEVFPENGWALIGLAMGRYFYPIFKDRLRFAGN